MILQRRISYLHFIRENSLAAHPTLARLGTYLHFWICSQEKSLGSSSPWDFTTPSAPQVLTGKSVSWWSLRDVDWWRCWERLRTSLYLTPGAGRRLGGSQSSQDWGRLYMIILLPANWTNLPTPIISRDKEKSNSVMRRTNPRILCHQSPDSTLNNPEPQGWGEYREEHPGSPSDNYILHIWLVPGGRWRDRVFIPAEMLSPTFLRGVTWPGCTWLGGRGQSQSTLWYSSSTIRIEVFYYLIIITIPPKLNSS